MADIATAHHVQLHVLSVLRQGEATVKQLSAGLPGWANVHRALRKLHAEGLVEVEREQRIARGRPVKIWRIA